MDTLDDLEANEEYSERASRFLQGLGKDDDTVENLYSYFRDAEYNLYSGTKRAFEELPNLTAEQKNDYTYLKTRFDRADTGGAKQWLRATADIGLDIATDPTMLLSLLLTPVTGGGSLATRASLAQAARVGLKRVGKSFKPDKTLKAYKQGALDARGNRPGLTRGKAIRDYYGGEARRLGYLGAAEGAIWGGSAEYLAQERDAIDGINLRYDKSLSEVALVGAVSGMLGGAIGRYGTKFGQKFDKHTQENLLKFSDENMLDRTDPAFKMRQGMQTILSKTIGKPTTRLLALAEHVPHVELFLKTIRYDALKFQEAKLWSTETGYDDKFLERVIKGEESVGPVDYKRALDAVHGKLKVALSDAINITTGGHRKLSSSENDILDAMARDKQVQTYLKSRDQKKAFSLIKKLHPEANDNLIRTLKHTREEVLDATLELGEEHGFWKKALQRGPNAYFMRKYDRDAVEQNANELIEEIVKQDAVAPDVSIVAKHLDSKDTELFVNLTDDSAMLIDLMNQVAVMPITKLSEQIDNVYKKFVGFIDFKKIVKDEKTHNIHLSPEATSGEAYTSIHNLLLGMHKEQQRLLNKVPKNAETIASQRKIASDIVDGMLDLENVNREVDLIEGTPITTSHFSPRSLYKLDDKTIHKFISHDFTTLMEDYIGEQSRLFARAKTLGTSIEDVTARFIEPAQKELAEQGGTLTKSEKQAMLDLWKITTGLDDTSFDSDIGQGASDLVKLMQATAHLPLATMSSATEILIPLTRVGVTTYARGLKEAGKNIGYHLGNQIKRFTGDTITNTRKILQDEHGITAKEADREMERVLLGIEQAVAQRVEALTGEGVKSASVRWLMNKFFKATLLSQWTRTVQLASFTMGKDLITRNLKTIASLQAVEGTLTASQIKKRSSAAQELFDLGVDIKGGLDWVAKGSKRYKSVDTVKNANTGLMQWNNFYETNVMPGASRFASEVILDPSRASAIRPHVQTSKYGSIIFQFLGYPTAFTNTVLQNWLLQAKRKPVESTARIASTTLLMTGVATALNAVRTDGKSLEKEPDEVLLDSISRWGGLGMMEYAFRAEKNREVGGGLLGSTVKAVTGPTVGDVMDTLLYRKGATEVAATNLPFYSAYDLGSNVGLLPEDFRANIKKKAKEVDRSFSEAVGWTRPRRPLSPMNQYSKATRQYKEPALEYGRVQYIKGGSVGEEVERTGKNPSSRIDRMTGVPYEEQAGAILDNEERETFALGSVVKKPIQEIMKYMTSKEYARDPLRKNIEHIARSLEPNFGSAYSNQDEIPHGAPSIGDEWLITDFIRDSVEKKDFYVIGGLENKRLEVAPSMAKSIESTDSGLNINLLPGKVRIRNPVAWDRDIPENLIDLMNDEDFVRLVREPTYKEDTRAADLEVFTSIKARKANEAYLPILEKKPFLTAEEEDHKAKILLFNAQEAPTLRKSTEGVEALSPFAELQKHIDEQEEYLKSLNFKGSKFNESNVREVIRRDWDKKFNKVLQGLGYDVIRYKNTKLKDPSDGRGELIDRIQDPEARILYSITRNLTAEGKARLDQGFLDAREAGSLPEFMETLKENIALSDEDASSMYTFDLDDVLEEIDIGWNGMPVVTLPKFKVINDPELPVLGRYYGKTGEIRINEDRISKFYDKAKIQNQILFPEIRDQNRVRIPEIRFNDGFPDLESFREHVLKHEMTHSQFFQKKGEVYEGKFDRYKFKVPFKKHTPESIYEARINQIAFNAKIDPEKDTFNSKVYDIKPKEGNLSPAQQKSELYRAGLTEEDITGYVLFDESQFLSQGRAKAATPEEIKIINDTDLSVKVDFITSNEVRAFDPAGASQLLAPLKGAEDSINLVSTATSKGGVGKVISYRLIGSELLDDLANRTSSPIDATGDEKGVYTTLLKKFTNSLSIRKGKTVRRARGDIPKGQEANYNRIMPEARFLKLEIDSGNNIKIDASEYAEWGVIADIRNQDWVGPKGYLYHPPDNNVASRESEVWRHLNSTDTKLEKALKKYERNKLKAMRKEYLERKKYGAAFSGGSGTGESYKTRYGEEVVADAEDSAPSGSPYDKRIDLEDPERGQILSRSAKEAEEARKWMKENEKYIEPPKGLQLDIIYSRSGKEVEDLDPDTLRVFGDNLDRAGKGGQAVIRDQRNTFGIATKRAPRRDEAAYFSDKPDEIKAVKADIARLLATGKEFVIPKGGLGTGLAQLQNRSPKIAKIIDEFMEKYVSKPEKTKPKSLLDK